MGPQGELESQRSVLHEQYKSRRVEVISKMLGEYIWAWSEVERGFDDLLKPKGEAESMEYLDALCEPLLPERYDEAQAMRPRQPADLGEPYGCNTLLRLAERAAEACTTGGPFERLATALQQKGATPSRASTTGGGDFTVDLAPVKGFRRALEKAQTDYGGNFLCLNDVARMTVIAPKLSSIAEMVRWLIEDSKVRQTCASWAESEPIPRLLG